MKKLVVQIITLTSALLLANVAQAQTNQAKINQLRNSARVHEQQAKDYDAKAVRYENLAKTSPNAKPAAIAKYEADAKNLRNMAAEQRRLAQEKTAEADRLEKSKP
ncbi:MAG: hypothetical protein EBZ78_01585 [Verrucomicrobia bacterium]|nr:hypothetical protein [Verrucomicrobiota bacterium]